PPSGWWELGCTPPAKQARLTAFFPPPPTRAERQPIVRPSPDLLYSVCVFDVSRAPVLIDVPPIPEHYWSVSIFDARTDVAAVRSDRDTGGAPAPPPLPPPRAPAPGGPRARAGPPPPGGAPRCRVVSPGGAQHTPPPPRP